MPGYHRRKHRDKHYGYYRHNYHRHHAHYHHHRIRRFRKKVFYLLPIIILCVGLAALITAGSSNFLTATGNVILYGIMVFVLPILVIFFLCRVFAEWIFAALMFLYTLFTRKKHR